MKHKESKITSIVSCFYGSNDNQTLPVGFNWSQILATKYGNKYRVTILLHGTCLKYGLKNKVYYAKYGINNPFSEFLKNAHKKLDIRIVICHLCLTNDGFTDSDLLKVVKPIPFSVDFILESQTKPCHFVVYDAELSQ